MATATAAVTANASQDPLAGFGAAIGNVLKDPAVVGAIGGVAGAVVNNLLPKPGETPQEAAARIAAEKAAAEAKQTQMLVVGGVVAVVIVVVIVIVVRSRGK